MMHSNGHGLHQRSLQALRPILLMGLLAVAAGPALARDVPKETDKSTYDQDTVLQDAQNFFGEGTEGLAKVIEKAFKDHGRPNAYITGEEASGAGALLGNNVGGQHDRR